MHPWSTGNGTSPASASAAGANCPGLTPAAPFPASMLERSSTSVASCTSTPIDDAPGVVAFAEVMAKPSMRASVVAPVTRSGTELVAAVHAVRQFARQFVKKMHHLGAVTL